MVSVPPVWEQTGDTAPFLTLCLLLHLVRCQTCSKDQESRLVPAGVLVTGMCKAANSHQREDLLVQTDSVVQLQIGPHL